MKKFLDDAVMGDGKGGDRKKRKKEKYLQISEETVGFKSNDE